MVAQLRSAGIDVKVDPQSYPNGRFARLHDPEGNPIECGNQQNLVLQIRCCQRRTLTGSRQFGSCSVPEVVLYRKREWAGRMPERGVFARFRYNDLKGAGRDCGGRGVVMQIQW